MPCYLYASSGLVPFSPLCPIAFKKAVETVMLQDLIAALLFFGVLRISVGRSHGRHTIRRKSLLLFL